MVTNCTNFWAAFRFFEWLETNQVPPPTFPVTASLSPFHVNGAATPSCPAGTSSDSGLWKIAPAYHAGPGIISTLPEYFFKNSGVNTLTTGTVPLSRRVSSIEAARLHSAEPVFTVTDLGPVTSLAWHLLAHM